MTFLHPWFLLGMVLTVVPVLIHLWYKRRLKRIPFSTLQFLKRTEARRFGWLKLREWLILVLRCLLILFLFLSLSRPQLRSRLSRIGELASVFLIIDNSYSMSYNGNFQKMINMAELIVSMYSQNSEFCIVPVCDEQNEESFWMTRKSVMVVLKNIRLGYCAGNISHALANAPSIEPKYQVEYIYIGDGQSINFKDFPIEVTTQSNFYWVRIPAGSNVGIASVTLKDPVAVAVNEYDLRTTIANYSSRLWSGKVGMTSGGYYVEKKCDVQPATECEIDFVLPPELNLGKVEIFDDSLLVDNVYYFSKSLPRSISLSLVGNNPYITNALTSGHDSVVPFNIYQTSKLSNIDLRKYNIVILDGVQAISEADKIRLLNHLNDPGSGLVVILGDEIDDNLRDFLSKWCRIEDIIVPKGYVTIDWIAHEHPIFSVFGLSNSLSDVQYSRYVKVEAEQGVLARFAGGAPFIIVRDNMCLVTGSLNAQSTNFVFKSTFVPTLLRLMVNLVSESDREEFYVGDRIPRYGLVKSPNGEYLGADDIFSMPGFHLADKETICVNVRPQEGDLSILGQERADILNVQQIDPEHHLVGSDLTNFFLLLALVALAFELALLLIH